MKYKVSTLEGALLDAAVAMVWMPAEWREIIKPDDPYFPECAGKPYCRIDVRRHSRGSTCWLVYGRDGLERRYSPSSNWKQGGPIVAVERLWTSCADVGDGGEWFASFPPHTEVSEGDGPPETQRIFSGPSLLVAAMRAHVASRFGPEIDIPEAPCQP